MTERRRLILASLALLPPLVIAYVLLPGQAFVNFDDQPWLLDNPATAGGLSWAGLRWAFSLHGLGPWTPLAWLSHMLDFSLFGAHPAGPKLHNLLLHALTTLACFHAWRRLTGNARRAWIVALLWSLHPLRVEAVAWIIERKELLCGLWSMLTLLTYARYVRTRSRGAYGLTLLNLTLALLAKPMAITLPCVLLLLDVWPLGRWRAGQPGPERRQLLMEKLPMLPLLVGSGVMAVLNSAHSEAFSALATRPLGLRLLNAVWAYGWYVLKFSWPTNLATAYAYQEHPVLVQVAAAGALLALVTTLAVVRWRRTGKADVLVGWLIFLGMLTPVSGMAQVGHQFYADRFTYLPQMGLTAAVVWALGDWAQRRRISPRGISAAVLALALTLSALTFMQTRWWHDSRTLLSRTLALGHVSYTTCCNLGLALLDEEQPLAALPLLEQALALEPQAAPAYLHAGTAQLQLHHPDAAAALLGRYVELRPADPRGYANLALALVQTGRLGEARLLLSRRVEQVPTDALAWRNRGLVAAAAGDFPAAIADYQQALALTPDDPLTHNNLGVALAQSDQLPAALRHFATAARLDPAYREAVANAERARAELSALAR